MRSADVPSASPNAEAGGTPALRPAIELRSVSKHFGAVAAVSDVSLAIRAGEFLTLLGPSGCGKTTVLRMIAGFETPERGAVLLDGADVTQAPPYRRDVNQVFQSYALFPHLTVRENIAFGLRMQRLPEREVGARIDEAVALVSLGGLERRRPDELSGGQRQRVALARALAPRPAVLLLDEPLSALDVQLRHAMQLELKRLQRRLGTTFVFVTHDQEEALTMSDRIALMNAGRIEQVGEVHEIYHRPRTAFAAEFIGAANLLDAELVGRDAGSVRVRVGENGALALQLDANAWPAGATRARVAIRPEKVHVTKSPVAGENTFEARVIEEVFKGATDRLVLETASGVRLVAVAANESALREAIHAGDRVWCALHADDLAIVPGG